MPTLPNTNFFPVNSETYSSTLNGSIAAGAATVPVASSSPYVDGDVVVLTVEPGVTGQQATFTGTKSGASFINCTWTEGNVGVGHAGGVAIKDYDSATHYGLVTKGARVGHNQDGTHKAFTESNIVTSAAIQTSAVTNAKIAGVAADKFSNPYKFRAYRNAAQNTSAGTYVKVAFDSENYDTGNNFDTTTNNRFTAPVNGFYQFNARTGIPSSAGTTQVGCALYKNGSATSYGSFYGSTAGTGPIQSVVSDCIQLVAGDYIELYAFCNATTAMEVGPASNWLSGFLVSTT